MYIWAAGRARIAWRPLNLPCTSRSRAVSAKNEVRAAGSLRTWAGTSALAAAMMRGSPSEICNCTMRRQSEPKSTPMGFALAATIVLMNPNIPFLRFRGLAAHRHLLRARWLSNLDLRYAPGRVKPGKPRGPDKLRRIRMPRPLLMEISTLARGTFRRDGAQYARSK